MRSLCVFNRLLSSVLFALLIISPLMVFATDDDSDFGFFRYPHTNGKDVVFTSEGDLWTAPLAGGMASRLTTHVGEERFAHFSPNGKSIAYSGQYDGQDDVYIISIHGGSPKRLTFHPDRDFVCGWTSDNKVLFRSTRDIPFRGYRIYHINPEGGYPVMIPLTKATFISFQPNGDKIAFNRYSREFRDWKRYQGGWAQDIWIGNLGRDEFINATDQNEINDWDGTDAFPMWHTDDRIYFLSDRSGRANIWSMLEDGSDAKQHTNHDRFDVRFPSLGNGTIVYQNGMDIWAYDISEDTQKQIDITLPSDRVQAREKPGNPERYLTSYQIAPDGKRLLLCARGEVFTAPARGEGLIRQLTYGSGVREKFPRWSDDGETIYYWSDRSGEEELFAISAIGGEEKFVGDDEKGWNYPPLPSPDGKLLLYSNDDQQLVVMDVKNGKRKIIDQGSWEITDYSWSPDSRFITWSKPMINLNNTIHIWDTKKDKSYQVTNDYFNSDSPVFDPEGKYLYFLSDRIANPHLDGQEMTYILNDRTLVYAAILDSKTPSPFAPVADPEVGEDDEWGDHKWGKDKEEDEEDDKNVKVVIDFEGLSERIVPFPIASGNYGDLQAAKEKVFYRSWEKRGMMGWSEYDEDDHGVSLHRFDLKKKKHKEIAGSVQGYQISADNKKILLRKDGNFIVKDIDTDDFGELKPDDYAKLDDWTMRVNVREEWQQMFREAWRFQRDFFWTEDMHQVNWQAIYDKYNALSHRISTRDELNDLIGELFGELNCSHTYVWGGDQRGADRYSTGMLGADLSRDESGFYRIDHIIECRPWEEKRTSPLNLPGLDVDEGDFITAIDGRRVDEADNIYRLLLGKAGKITSLMINDKPKYDDSHEIIIKPLGNEGGLRYLDWVENRRQYVAEKTHGQVGYIHLANMGGMGLSQFTESYQPQHTKPALIMDVRYNGGGFVAEMILSHLAREVFSFGKPRHGGLYRNPQTGFYGHMAAVCNGETGSDGETFTEGFQELGLGPVIGTRTWGGWVGIRMDKRLLDRGMVSQPEFTGWNLRREYMIEGWGTDPDKVVPEHPTAELYGTDPQLDATIEYLLEKLESAPVVIPEPPVTPDRSGFGR